MSKVKQIMVSSVFLSIIAVLLINCLYSTAYAAPQAVAAGGGAVSGAAAGTTATTSSTTGSIATGVGATPSTGATFSTAAAGPFNGVQGLVGGALNFASMPLNTLTASLSQLGLPSIATAPLSAVSSLFQQAGTVYGR